MDHSEHPEGESPLSDVSRRDFIKTGAALATTVAAAKVLPAHELQAGPLRTQGDAAPEALEIPRAVMDIILNINGQELSLTVEPRVTLAEALRNDVGLTGAKIGCDRAACGACTVIIDGRSTLSCSMLAVEAEGMSIETVESLADGGALHPIQSAFVRNDALQCGFCTPGMVMSCKALLDDNALPSDQAIKDGLAGNLCRCGTYPRIFQAVRDASEEMA